MKLDNKRFIIYPVTPSSTINSEYQFTYYGYNSKINHLYVVAVRNRDRAYFINNASRGYECTEQHPIHRAIEKHFNL